MKILKTLMVAAALAAIVTPAKAVSLGQVDYKLLPIACRNLDDAIEASKLDTSSHELVYGFRPNGGPVYPHVAWVLRHQLGSKIEHGPYMDQRIPPDRDCRWPDGSMATIFGDKTIEAHLRTAVKVKLTAPNLPPGKIAVCVIPGSDAIGDKPRDCAGEPPTKNSVGYWMATYWVVVDPKGLVRDFDLPKGE